MSVRERYREAVGEAFDDLAVGRFIGEVADRNIGGHRRAGGSGHMGAGFLYGTGGAVEAVALEDAHLFGNRRRDIHMISDDVVEYLPAFFGIDGGQQGLGERSDRTETT